MGTADEEMASVGSGPHVDPGSDIDSPAAVRQWEDLEGHPAWEAAQSILILVLALTGVYLYVFRLVNKRKRQRRSVTVESHSPIGSR